LVRELDVFRGNVVVRWLEKMCGSNGVKLGKNLGGQMSTQAGQIAGGYDLQVNRSEMESPTFPASTRSFPRSDNDAGSEAASNNPCVARPLSLCESSRKKWKRDAGWLDVADDRGAKVLYNHSLLVCRNSTTRNGDADRSYTNVFGPRLPCPRNISVVSIATSTRR
jgi:hypothetical protein